MSRSTALLRGLALCFAILLVPAIGNAETGNPKALKYHEALLKRPTPGYLYDRFYNTWLDTDSLDTLKAFLSERVEQSNGTADRLLLAFYYAKQGDDVKALQQFRTALANDPGNAHAWYHKAIVEARTLDFETAIVDLETANKSKPDKKLATLISKLQGKLYVRNRQTEKAMAIWKKLLDANPKDEDLYEDIIELQIAEGLFDEAIELSNTLINNTADKYKQVIRRVRTGDIQQRAGKRTQALEIYAATLADVGHGTWLEREILAQIEELFRREDDLVGLKEEYEKLLAQYPKRIQVHKQFARLLSEQGEIEQAQKQFENILRLTPGNRANTEAYVSLLASNDKLPDAIKVMKALIEQNADDTELQIRLARLHHQAEDNTAAAAALLKFLKSSDKSEYAF
ncbi:MAG: tetratricopeptide repeat protein, partial [Planctomycetales bacterium]